MLAGQISNQDEDEVEDELENLEREVRGEQLPDVPDSALPEPTEEEKEQKRKERAKARARERAAMLAS